MKPKPQFAAHTPNKNPGHWHDLIDHLQSVAEIAKVFAEQLKLGKLGYYAGLWHDLGKYNSKFQDYLQQCHDDEISGNKQKRRGPNHKTYGAVFADEHCSFLAPIIQGHHGGLPCFDEMEETCDEFLDQLQELDSYENVLELATQDLGMLNPSEDLDEMLESILEDDPLVADVIYRLLFSCLIDADHLDTERHFEKDNAEARERYSREEIAKLWSTFEIIQKEFAAKSQQKNPDSTVNPIREEVYQACLTAAVQKPGIFRLAVPTGGGKTLSGLAFALKHADENDLQRVIVAVPYTSIIEQTVNVYREILGTENVLEHHSAVKAEFFTGKEKEDFQVDEGAQRSQAQARLVTQNWDAPLIVTTTVQLFESLFGHRPSKCRKLHNIVKSVIILDEVQTLPISLLQPIVSMLEELVRRYQVSVVLCTATQPALDSVSGYFKGFESSLITDIIEPNRACEHFQQLKRVEYDYSSIQTKEKWSWERLAVDLRTHPQALTILNTRKDALAILSALGIASDKYLETESPQDLVQSVLENRENSILHLSTLLCGAHRQAVLTEVRNRLDPKQLRPCLLISTQVVEAGVDLDFPTVYRALGPLDRIVQAAGRCNREGRRSASKSRVVIFDPEEGSLPRKGSEYEKATHQAHSLLLDSDFDPHNPLNFKGYFESLYMIENTDGKKIQDLRKNHNFPKVAEKFKLIENNTVPIVVRYNETVNHLLRDIERRGFWSSDYRKLQPYIVNLPEWEFRKAKQDGTVEPLIGSDSIFVLASGIYHPIRGVPIGEDPGDWVYRDALVF
jgi:CRISPR-associated endonuclease/helicase Cas3